MIAQTTAKTTKKRSPAKAERSGKPLKIRTTVRTITRIDTTACVIIVKNVAILCFITCASLSNWNFGAKILKQSPRNAKPTFAATGVKIIKIEYMGEAPAATIIKSEESNTGGVVTII